MDWALGHPAGRWPAWHKTKIYTIIGCTGILSYISVFQSVINQHLFTIGFFLKYSCLIFFSSLMHPLWINYYHCFFLSQGQEVYVQSLFYSKDRFPVLLHTVHHCIPSCYQSDSLMFFCKEFDTFQRNSFYWWYFPHVYLLLSKSEVAQMNGM